MLIRAPPRRGVCLSNSSSCSSSGPRSSVSGGSWRLPKAHWSGAPGVLGCRHLGDTEHFHTLRRRASAAKFWGPTAHNDIVVIFAPPRRGVGFVLHIVLISFDVGHSPPAVLTGGATCSQNAVRGPCCIVSRCLTGLAGLLESRTIARSDRVLLRLLVHNVDDNMDHV
jgi:hypothetical protein